MSLMQVMRILGPNLWGWIADHTQRRVSVLRVTALCACIAFCGMFFGRDFAGFFAVMVAINLFTSAQGPMSEAVMLSEMRGDLTHYGRLRLWGSVGFIAAVLIAGPVTDRYGIEAMPWIALGFLLLTFLSSMAMKETSQPHSSSAPPSVWSL
ncbi:MAG: transporter, partial [Paucimonas sp.]|nr:transporter [Paucimonas sp.]